MATSPVGPNRCEPVAARLGNCFQQWTERCAAAARPPACAKWLRPSVTKGKNQPASVSQPLAGVGFFSEASPYDAKAPLLQRLITIRQIVRVPTREPSGIGAGLAGEVRLEPRADRTETQEKAMQPV